MTLYVLSRDDERYPAQLSGLLGDSAPKRIFALGNLDILHSPLLALFCSSKCPGSIILQTYDLACALRDSGVTVISGFHSPIEKECLRLLLRGSQPIVICPARSIERMRVPTEWRDALAAGRLLLLSPFPESCRRMTREQAAIRNEIVAAIADKVCIAHAAPGGQTEGFARQVLSWGKPLLTLDDEPNEPLVALGAVPISAATWAAPP